MRDITRLTHLGAFKTRRGQIRDTLEDRALDAIKAIEGHYRADVRLGEERTDNIYVRKSKYWEHLKAYTELTADTKFQAATEDAR